MRRRQKPRAAGEPTNVVREWEAAVAQPTGSLTLTGAMMMLNAELKARYDLARLGQWRRGERPIPQAVVAYMQKDVVMHLLRADGFLAKIAGIDLESLGTAIVTRLQLPPLKQ